MKISDEVLAVLSGLRFDGTNVVIAKQLDRKLYVKVNQVLEACGGKWSRKAKAHIFEEEAEPILEATILRGEVRTKREDQKELGWFPTPEGLAHELVERAGVAPGDDVLEPSAGDGAIVKVLLKAGADVTAIEIDIGRCQALKQIESPRLNVMCQDFFGLVSGRDFDSVVMNPPFTARVFDHVRQAFGCIRSGGTLVSVLPAGVRFRQDRRHTDFKRWLSQHDPNHTIEDLPSGSFAGSGTGVNTVVLRATAPLRVSDR